MDVPKVNTAMAGAVQRKDPAVQSVVGVQDLSRCEQCAYTAVAKVLVVWKEVYEIQYCLSSEQDDLWVFPEVQGLALLVQGTQL